MIAGILNGDDRAFEILLERYRPLVARIVNAKVPRDQAVELVHEVFIRAFESLANYRPLKPFGHWLSILAVRACHDFWRGRYASREVPQSALSEAQQVWLEAAASGEGPGESLHQRLEARELLDWALGHLKPEDRLALTLVHLEGHSMAEAAELLGWSVASVKVRTFRARRKLRGIIAQSLGEGEASHEEK